MDGNVDIACPLPRFRYYDGVTETVIGAVWKGCVACGKEVSLHFVLPTTVKGDAVFISYDIGAAIERKVVVDRALGVQIDVFKVDTAVVRGVGYAVDGSIKKVKGTTGGGKLHIQVHRVVKSTL